MTDEWENNDDPVVSISLEMIPDDLPELAEKAEQRNEDKIVAIMSRHQHDWADRVIIHDWSEDNRQLTSYLGREGQGEGEGEQPTAEETLLGNLGITCWAPGRFFIRTLLRRTLGNGCKVYLSLALQIRLGLVV